MFIQVDCTNKDKNKDKTQFKHFHASTIYLQSDNKTKH